MGFFDHWGLDLQDHDVVSFSIEKVADNGEGSNTEATLFDVLNEVGLVGCVKDGLSDLSTRRRHIEGFGKSDTYGPKSPYHKEK